MVARPAHLLLVAMTLGAGACGSPPPSTASLEHVTAARSRSGAAPTASTVASPGAPAASRPPPGEVSLVMPVCEANEVKDWLGLLADADAILGLCGYEGWGARVDRTGAVTEDHRPLFGLPGAREREVPDAITVVGGATWLGRSVEDPATRKGSLQFAVQRGETWHPLDDKKLPGWRRLLAIVASAIMPAGDHDVLVAGLFIRKGMGLYRVRLGP